MDLFSIAMTV